MTAYFYKGMTPDIQKQVSGLLYNKSESSVTRAVTTVARHLGLVAREGDSALAVQQKMVEVERLVDDIYAGLKDGSITTDGTKPVPEVTSKDAPALEENGSGEDSLITEEELQKLADERAADVAEFEGDEPFDEDADDDVELTKFGKNFEFWQNKK